MRVLALLLCLCAARAENVFNYITQIYSETDRIPERVRTLAEYKDRRDEFVVLDFIGLVERYEGYTAEEFEVTTDDGYILGLHRVSGSPGHPKAAGKPVVYIQHGLLETTEFLVFLGRDDSIVFQLADAGYDVWLGNVRGNSYSRRHETLSPDLNAEEFWNFSLDEIAAHDLPRFIDFVLAETKKDNLTFIGYSMGGTLSFMLLSSKPGYNDKINLLVNFAPEVYYSYLPRLDFAINLESVLAYSKFKDMQEVLPQSVNMQKFTRQYCSDGGSNICSKMFSFSIDIDKMHPEVIPGTFAYSPAGTSYKVMKHYEQLAFANRRFQRYQGCSVIFCADKLFTGWNDSLEYDLSSVTVPNLLVFAKDDVYTKIVDLQYLKSKLSNVVDSMLITEDKFNHLDFILSKDAKRLIFDRVLEVMSRYLANK